ncbi:MAG: cob(I)yrinic acid a,c-diamide adenosyltransferase [Elusimicrobia bacterium]|nr:cob(I)yrinic acid a,c-diamide adenosyltransferase [Elusimicrobiota bacterium]
MKIYTKTGDKGETGLRGNVRVPKSHPRVSAYGDVDELNSALGAALAALPRRRAFAALRLDLERAQRELFEAGAALAAPAGTPPASAFPAGREAWMEPEIDRLWGQLPPLDCFILPGGVPAAAALHVARAVCRRAERSVVALGAEAPAGVVIHLNRLADFLFAAARWTNRRLGGAETGWRGS